MKPGVLAAAIVMACALPAGAQEVPAAPVVPPQAASIPIGTHVGRMPSGYEDGGRRDPFASLIAPRRAATGMPVDASRGRTGLAAVALADVTVRGIVKSGARVLAILEGANRQSFVARPDDQLLDASIHSIDDNGVVFAEYVGADVPPIQVRKTLRSAAEEIR